MTQPAPLPPDEDRRLNRLKALAILDSTAEPVFDALARVASEVCGAPIALISLIDQSRQWFKANVGLDGVSETPRDVAFCSHAILGDSILEVPDATRDVRFKANPLVTGAPDIRFYAGAPLVMSTGERIGTLCVIDRQARQINPSQRAILAQLARAVVQTMEVREKAHYLALMASDPKYHALSDASPVGIIHTDLLGQCTYTNKRWQDIHGQTLGESLGQGWHLSLHPDDRALTISNWNFVIQGGGQIEQDLRVVRSSGELLHVRLHAKAYSDFDGRIAGCIGAVLDITEARQTQERLKASNAFLDRAERIAGVGGWEMDIQAGTLRWTDQTCRIYDLPAGHKPQMDEHLKHFDEQSREIIARNVAEATRTRKPWDVELPMVTAKGRKIWIRSVGQVVETLNGKPLRLVGALQDVTDKKAMEEKLRHANAQMSAILENLPCGVSVFDSDLGLTMYNRRFQTMLGFPSTLFEAPKPSFESFVRFNAEQGEYGEGSVEEKVASIVDRARDPAVHRLERVRSDGTALYIQGAPMPGGGFVTAYVDVSEKKLSESALRVSEERQQRALAASGLALWDFDLRSGQVYLSPAWAEMRGESAQPTVLHIRELAALVPLEEHAGVTGAVRKVLKGEAPAYSIEHRVAKADGEYIWVLSEGRVAERDAAGRVVRAVGTNRNVTERKRVRDELVRTTSLLKAVLDAATGVLVICVDLQGVITVFNRGAELLLGYAADKVVGRHGDAIFGAVMDLPAYVKIMTERLRRPASVGEVFAHQSVRDQVREWTVKRRDGAVLQLALVISDVQSSRGERLGYLATGHDVTQQREHERSLEEARAAAEQASQAKAAFLATMSHEIRTPMNGVIGMTSLLLDTQLSLEQREFTEVIRQSGEGLLVVINDILDFSKIESGRMELEWMPLDIQESVESSIELLGLKAQEKRLDLLYLIEPDVPTWIMGDMSRLRQILVNLISNALKFTESGEVVVTVRRSEMASADVDKPLVLEIAVEDTGIGIAEETLPFLFQAFTQADSSTSRKFGGTGLGLAICRRLVEAMGGDIRARSTVGEGTRISFTVQTAPTEQIAPGVRDSLAELRGRRVLLLDDNLTNLRILGLQADRWGMRHRACSSGTEALAMIDAGERFDLVVADLQMPGMDGAAFARALGARQQAPPIVLLSSMDLRHSQDAGLFAAVLMKPARHAVLFDAMVRALPAVAPRSDRVSRPSVSQFDPELGQRLPLRILLAEDNEINQMVALHILKGFGYKADVAANGLEVLDALRRQPYDLVLMDIQMPEMDGLEATRSIVRNWPASARPHILAMSANVMREDTDAAMAAGMDDYLTKPIAVPALRAVLESLGEGRRALAESKT